MKGFPNLDHVHVFLFLHLLLKSGRDLMPQSRCNFPLGSRPKIYIYIFWEYTQIQGDL